MTGRGRNRAMDDAITLARPRRPRAATHHADCAVTSLVARSPYPTRPTAIITAIGGLGRLGLFPLPISIHKPQGLNCENRVVTRSVLSDIFIVAAVGPVVASATLCDLLTYSGGCLHCPCWNNACCEVDLAKCYRLRWYSCIMLKRAVDKGNLPFLRLTHNTGSLIRIA